MPITTVDYRGDPINDFVELRERQRVRESFRSPLTLVSVTGAGDLVHFGGPILHCTRKPRWFFRSESREYVAGVLKKVGLSSDLLPDIIRQGLALPLEWNLAMALYSLDLPVNVAIIALRGKAAGQPVRPSERAGSEWFPGEMDQFYMPELGLDGKPQPWDKTWLRRVHTYSLIPDEPIQ